MQYIFKTFNVGSGDCITLLLKNNDKETHIMVDCGKYSPDVNDYIVNVFKCHIDYLIVSHIDNDHVNGLISMLSSMPNLSIGHILYNCYQRTSGNLKDWDGKMKANVARIYGHLPVVLDMLAGKVNTESSKTLAELILQNAAWKNAWDRNYITSETEPIELENNMGRLMFLSPTKTELDILDAKYRKLFWNTLYKKKEEDYKKEETIYEALMRIMAEDHHDPILEKISAIILNGDTIKMFADECLGNLTPENKASIAFIWEHENHRILFCGDAAPDILFSKLEEAYEDCPKPIIFDIIKVAHHGSAHSVSKEQMNLADSCRYFVTGGSSNRPSYQALSRIITASLPTNISYREIRFNRENAILRNFANNETLKEKIHYAIISDANEYEISY